jgi:hypothetical protein
MERLEVESRVAQRNRRGQLTLYDNLLVGKVLYLASQVLGLVREDRMLLNVSIFDDREAIDVTETNGQEVDNFP